MAGARSTAKDDDTDEPAPAKAPARKAAKPADDDPLAKGYVGFVPDENPNSAYSLQSGPDSPLLVPDNKTSFHAPPKENPDA
jgi:hypothetical protein